MHYEYFGNIHMHTTHSDGVGTFAQVVDAAHQAQVDFIFVTDHNVLVREQEEGYRRGVLALVGEEAHDDDRVPQRNHLLCLGITQDVASYARDPQVLINSVREQGALTFLAHPFEEVTIKATLHWGWENWEANDYTGVELWNYMSAFRGFTTSTLRSLLMGYFPHYFLRGPLPVMLRKWDELTQTRAVVAIGGSDVHAHTYQIGPFRRIFLPYAHCCRALNTHILTPTPFLGSPSQDVDLHHEAVQHDRALLLTALQQGHCWTGYDLVAPSRGFRFAAWQAAQADSPFASPPHAHMGDTLAAATRDNVTHFRVITPQAGEIRLLRNGQVVRQQRGQELIYSSDQPGVYRVEVWKRRWGAPRGWIFSNPIYVR